MSGNREAEAHNPEDLLMIVDEKDDEAKIATFEHLYNTAYDEYNRFFAHSIWEFQGRILEMSLDFWLAGQRVTKVWFTALYKTPWWPSISSDQLRLMKEFIPIKSYLDFVKKLAFEISEQAERQYTSAQKDFWDAAEQTALAIMSAAVAATKSADEIRTALINEFEQFSSAIYLKYLREAAYFASEARTKSGYYGDALSDWLKAETAAQEKLRQGERIGTKSAEPEAQN